MPISTVIKNFLDNWLQSRPDATHVIQKGILEAPATASSSALFFGKRLDEVPKIDNVPVIVVDTCSWLLNHGTNEEGLFRVPGIAEEIKELKAQYDLNGTANLDNYDINSNAGVLKLFLRDMPEPLFMYACYDSLMSVARQHSNDDQQLLQALRSILAQLPESHKHLAVYLLNFLKQVSLNAAVNKMSIDNLAMVFAPNVLKAKEETLTSIMEDTTYIKIVMRTLITGAEQLQSTKQKLLEINKQRFGKSFVL